MADSRTDVRNIQDEPGHLIMPENQEVTKNKQTKTPTHIHSYNNTQ